MVRQPAVRKPCRSREIAASISRLAPNLLGPYHGGGFSDGVDDPEMVKQLPAGYSGGIATDRLDLIVPMLETD